MKVLAILSMLFASSAPAHAAPAQTTPTTIDGLPFTILPTQALPAKGCAAYLWTATGTRTLLAMATADPAQLRVSIGGTITDLPRDRQEGPDGFGFSDTTEYKAGDVTAVLDITIAARGDLKNGASVPDGTLRLDRMGQDSIVVPVVGLIGCA